MRKDIRDIRKIMDEIEEDYHRNIIIAKNEEERTVLTNRYINQIDILCREMTGL